MVAATPAFASPSRSSGLSRPVGADHAELAALKAGHVEHRQAARARHRPGRPPDPTTTRRFADGVEVLKDGTEMHLASFCFEDLALHLACGDDPAFTAIKTKHADVLGVAPPGLPPDRVMELELETGDGLMQRSRPVKRLSDRELADSALRAQLVDLLERGWIQHSTAGHAASVVYARKPDGIWCIRYD